jgi:hypothetical protein
LCLRLAFFVYAWSWTEQMFHGGPGHTVSKSLTAQIQEKQHLQTQFFFITGAFPFSPKLCQLHRELNIDDHRKSRLEKPKFVNTH